MNSVELQERDTAADWTPSEWRMAASLIKKNGMMYREKWNLSTEAKKMADWLEENELASLTHAMRRIENESGEIKVTKVGW